MKIFHLTKISLFAVQDQAGASVHQPRGPPLYAGEVGILALAHVLVEAVVAGALRLEHSHPQQVLEEDFVDGNGEHDGQALSGLWGLHVEEVVGQDAHRPLELELVLAERADLGHGGADGGLGRVEPEAAGHEDPEE